MLPRGRQEFGRLLAKREHARNGTAGDNRAPQQYGLREEPVLLEIGWKRAIDALSAAGSAPRRRSRPCRPDG